MSAAVSGVLHGKVIELDEPVPSLDGCRIRIVLEREVDIVPPEAWAVWATAGPQGPIEDDEDVDFP